MFEKSGRRDSIAGYHQPFTFSAAQIETKPVARLSVANRFFHGAIAFMVLLLWAFPAFTASGMPDFKGFNFTDWSEGGYGTTESNASAIRMEKTGSDTYTIIVSEYMDGPDSLTVGPKSGKTPSVEALGAIIDSLKSRGHKVILKPHVDLQDGTFRGDFKPSDPDRWFASYGAMLDKYAALARDHGVDVLCVGTELKGTTGLEKQWRETISRTRKNFNGKLTYASDWTNFDRVPFWDALDYAGIDSYFPLSKNGRTDLPSLLDGWAPHKNRIDKWQKTHGKPVIFTEIGFRNSANAASEPWAWGDKPERDDELQKRLFEATAITWHGTPYMAGMQFWDWPAAASGHQGVAFSPLGRPAESVVATWFDGSAAAEIEAVQRAREKLAATRDKYSGFLGFFRRLFSDADSEIRQAETEVAAAIVTYEVKASTGGGGLLTSAAPEGVAGTPTPGTGNLRDMLAQRDALAQRIAELRSTGGDYSNLSAALNDLEGKIVLLRAESLSR